MEGLKRILFEYLKKYREIILYGCGKNGRLLQWIFKQNNVEIAYWCDRNDTFWNSKIEGIECISPENLIEHQNAVVIVTMLENKEVLCQLRAHNFCDVLVWDDVKFLKEEMYQYQKQLKEYRRWVLDKIPALAKQLEKNRRYHNLHSGQRCFIIGNGPSVKEQDLSLLSDEITFTVNQIARNPQFAQLNTNYHLWADPGFFKMQPTCEGDYELIQIMKQLPDMTECFFPYEYAYQYVKKFGLEKSIHVNYYSSRQFVNQEEEIDFTEFIRGGYTVVQYAVRLALYMGFTEIYLLGCECTTILNVINARTLCYRSETHCYEINEDEKVRTRNMYCTLPMQAYYESERGVLEEYRILESYCRKRGVKLINCTPGGLLEEIQRAEYETVVGRMK